MTECKTCDVKARRMDRRELLLLMPAALCIKESQPRSGLLQSSLVTLYTMYLTWSAMTNEPGNMTFTTFKLCTGELSVHP